MRDAARHDNGIHRNGIHDNARRAEDQRWVIGASDRDAAPVAQRVRISTRVAVGCGSPVIGIFMGS